MNPKAKRYDNDLKSRAIHMVVSQKRSAAAVSKELGMSQNSLYDWISKYKRALKEKRLNPGEGADVRDVTRKAYAVAHEEMAKLRNKVTALQLERDHLARTIEILSRRYSGSED